jgi:hypothetical protein
MKYVNIRYNGAGAEGAVKLGEFLSKLLNLNSLEINFL